MENTTVSVAGRGRDEYLVLVRMASDAVSQLYIEPALLAALDVARKRGWGVRVTGHHGDRSIRVEATSKVRPECIEFGSWEV